MGIKQIIAVASAKGGVGKSTICANLASYFSKDFKVGILDADIYGPNQHILFDVLDSKPEVKTIDGQKSFMPIKVNNIFLNSMGFILDKDKAAMWRGPMLSGAIKQLKDLTQWGDLDYLFIDGSVMDNIPLYKFEIEMENSIAFKFVSVINNNTLVGYINCDTKKKIK